MANTFEKSVQTSIYLIQPPGCIGSNSLAIRKQQIPIRGAPAACSYDTTFDDVSGAGSEAITLSKYLIWVASYQPASANNASLMDVWIDYFHRCVAT